MKLEARIRRSGDDRRAIVSCRHGAVQALAGPCDARSDDALIVDTLEEHALVKPCDCAETYLRRMERKQAA